MGRKPKPWFDAERKEWCTRINGQKHRLGPDKKAADRRFHELMVASEEEAKPRQGALACEVADRFLGWVVSNRAPRTADWYKMHLQAFFTAVPNGSKLKATELKPFHVYDWVNAHPSWSPSFTRGAMVAVQRAMRWGVEAGFLEQNPLPVLRKPMATARETPVTPETHAKMLAAVKGEAFRDVLEFAWETGARPHEIKIVEARHFDAAGRKLILPPKEAKGKKRTRVIYLTEKAAGIVARRVQTQGPGLIFRNHDGGKWNMYSMNNRLARLAEKVGARHGLVDWRHGFCQRMLEGGMDHVTVAALMGHTNAAMIQKVYSHMSKASDFLMKQLEAVSG